MIRSHAVLPTPEGLKIARFSDFGTSYAHTAARQIPLVLGTDVYKSVRGDTSIYRHDDFVSLYIAERGRGTHVIEGVPYSIARGDVYVMGAGMCHWFSEGNDLRLHVLHFQPGLLEEATLDTLRATSGFLALFVEQPLERASGHSGGRWLHLTPTACAQVETELSELQREWEAGTAIGAVLARGLFLRLLVHLARLYAQDPGALMHADGSQRIAARTPGAEANRTIAAAVHWMDEHFAEEVRIEEMAARVFLSPDRFTQVFSAEMGRTPRDYLRHLRIERARILLQTTDAAIGQIGLEVGFSEPAYFTRVFRQETGHPPGAYRRMHRPGSR